MEEQSPAAPVTTATAPSPPRTTSRRTRSNRWLIVAILIVSLASFVVLGLLATSVLSIKSKPLQTKAERDVVMTVAIAKDTPRDTDAQVAAATAYLLAGDFDQALVYVDRATKLAPKDPSLKLLKAQVYQGKGDLKKARALVEELRKSVDRSETLYATSGAVMALIDQAEGNLTAAVEEMKVALGGDPTSTDLLVNLARLQEQTGKKDDAAATYGKALQYIPDLEPALTALRAMKSGPADYELAKVAWQAGNKDEARRLMEQAAGESPKVAWLQVALGDFRKLIGDTAGAKTAYEAALALDPANAEAKAGLDSL